MYTLSADIGGTFTDVVVFDESRSRVATGKALTTPDNLHEGVLHGLEDAAGKVGVELRALLGEAHRFVHATTQSSNAIFAFSGAKTAVITTKGFGDTLTIMRASGRVAGLSVFERHHYRMTGKPRLLADERDIFEIDERTDYAGRIVVKLDEAQLASIATTLKEKGYQAVAIAFLFSHKNPAQERTARDILKRLLPGVYVTMSADIAPVLGEYERSATALFNAYVGPVIESYLGTLVSSLGEAGLACSPLVVQANGGLVTPAQTIPIFTVESGPAAGVVGSAYLAAQLGLKDVIATDVGGTTFKVALIEGGQWTYAKETVLNQYQLRLPMIDVVSIGAGGGSIAWVDSGRLRVGPKSASSQPGPACYGLGGTEPTVTDADVVLGYISPDRFLGGRMALRRDLAEEAIRTRIANPLFGGDVTAAAAGIQPRGGRTNGRPDPQSHLAARPRPPRLCPHGLWRRRPRPRRLLRQRSRLHGDHRPVPRFRALRLWWRPVRRTLQPALLRPPNPSRAAGQAGSRLHPDGIQGRHDAGRCRGGARRP